MEKFRNLAVIGLTSVVMCIGLTSCSDNDEGNNGAISLPVVFEGKRLVKCEYKPIYSNNIEGETYQYDKDKLVSHTEFEVDNDDIFEEKYTIDYAKNQVKVSWKDGSDSDICTYTLNENGYAVSATLETREDEDVWNTYYTFEYDPDGYLIKITEKDDDYTETVNIKWQNGDAVSYGYDDYNYEYTYSSDLNKGGILPSDNGWLDLEADLYIAYYAGILGKPTKHLISKKEEKQNNNDYTYSEEYKYTLDEEGYIKTYTDGNITCSYTFQ